MVLLTLVSTPEQACRLITNVVNLVRTGESPIIKAALKTFGKDRKTVQRFRHIYYLNKINRALLEEVSEQGRLCCNPQKSGCRG